MTELELFAVELATTAVSDGTYLLPGWDVKRVRAALAQPATMFNGLTEAETDATASVFGLVGEQPASVPAGWKLVPVEPTDDMIHAGYMKLWGDQAARSDAESCWSAMLAAAPQAPQPAQADQAQSEANGVTVADILAEFDRRAAPGTGFYEPEEPAQIIRAMLSAAPQPEAQPSIPLESLVRDVTQAKRDLARLGFKASYLDWIIQAAPSAQAEPAKCISTNPNAQRPYRPDDFCPDMACGILGQCRRAGQAEQGGKQ